MVIEAFMIIYGNALVIIFQSWYEARDACSTQGGQLAVIRNPEENNIVAALAPVSSNMF